MEAENTGNFAVSCNELSLSALANFGVLLFVFRFLKDMCLASESYMFRVAKDRVLEGETYMFRKREGTKGGQKGSVRLEKCRFRALKQSIF